MLFISPGNTPLSKTLLSLWTPLHVVHNDTLPLQYYNELSINYAGAYVQCRSGQPLVEMLDAPIQFDLDAMITPPPQCPYNIMIASSIIKRRNCLRGCCEYLNIGVK